MEDKDKEKYRDAMMQSYKEAHIKHWCIKASSSSLDSYIVVMFNEKTDDCHILFGKSKDEIQLFIAFVLERDNIIL